MFDCLAACRTGGWTAYWLVALLLESKEDTRSGEGGDKTTHFSTTAIPLNLGLTNRSVATNEAW